MDIRKQAGVVNTLMVGLMAVGLLASTAVGINAIRSAQKQQLALHANTQATARAWDGVEIIRLYLTTLTATQLTALSTELAGLPNGKTLSITGVDHLTAKLVSIVTDASANRRITVHITGSGADTTATIQAIYTLLAGSGGGSATPPRLATVNVNSHLRMTGNVTVVGGTSANFLVDGDVDLSGSVSGVNEICATGNVEIGSAITVHRICSNGNLTLSGAANVVEIEVVGDVLLKGGAASSIGSIKANGDVSLTGGSASAGSIITKGDVSVTGGGATVSGVLNTEGAVNWTSSKGASTINANGNVVYQGKNGPTVINSRGTTTLSGNGNVQTLNSLGQIMLSSGYGLGVQGALTGGSGLTYTGQQKVVSGVVVGAISGPVVKAWDPVMNVTRDPSYTVNIPVVNAPVISPVLVPSAIVDVYTLKNSANYVFEIEPVTGKKVVTVRNVSTIDNGRYYIGNIGSNGYKDYLCKAVDASGGCTEPVSPYKTLCQGYSANNSCFTYTNGAWSIGGQTMAPGFAFFEGGLNVGNGVYINTFAATGNITTSGSTKVYSPNYAGFTGTCTDNRTAQGITTATRLYGIYPSDLCDGSTYKPSSIGNVALVAGGYLNGNYVGGDISVGASNEIYGSVIAGNLLSTTGNTTIVGRIQVANHRGGTTATTTWTGSTTIDLRNLPPGFDPTQTPCMSTSCQPVTPIAKTFWTRYL